MKYLISAENPLCEHLSALLVSELERFDIRSETKHVAANNKDISRAIRKFVPDLLILFGSKKINSLVFLGKRLNVKTYFFYQSLLDKTPSKTVVFPADKTYSDLPLKKDEFNWEYAGSLLYEFIRKQEYVDSDLSIVEPLISILIVNEEEMRDVKRLIGKLQIHHSKITFKVVNIFAYPREVVKMVSNSNLIIGISQLSNMIAVFTNCPAINVYGKSFFFKNMGVDRLVVNNLISKEVISSYPISRTALIAEEINKILNDHQYCAGIMSSYQELKSIIGMPPVSRQTARKIVDWLDKETI